MAGLYEYVAQDILTEDVICTLPCEGVRFDQTLNSVGNFQTAIHMDNDLISNTLLLEGTVPGRTAVVAYRNGQVVWGGPIWARWYNSQGKVLQFTAQTYESYLYRRRNEHTVSYTDKQSLIISDLWLKAQDTSLTGYNADVRVQIPVWDFPDDVVRNININVDDNKFYGEYVDRIMEFDNAPDYYVEVYDDDGIPRKRLVLGYPLLGREPFSSQLTLDYPGNILNYYYTESASKGGNAAWAVGDIAEDSDDGPAPSEVATMNPGPWPLLETIVNYQGVTVTATLQSKAAQQLRDYGMPTETWQFFIRPDEMPEFGTYSLGDYGHVQIDGDIDPRFAGVGYEGDVRVVGWDVSPGGEGAESIQLILQQVNND